MKQAEFLAASGATRNELDGARRRGLLPFLRHDPGSWTDFSDQDVLRFRTFIRLFRSGVKGGVASNIAMKANPVEAEALILIIERPQSGKQE